MGISPPGSGGASSFEVRKRWRGGWSIPKLFYWGLQITYCWILMSHAANWRICLL